MGRYVAKMLSNENHDITIMDESEERLQDLDTNYDIMSRIGSPTSVNDLQMCGVRNCDLFIAVNTSESVNTTACMIASKLGARKTVARIDNYEYLLPKNKEMFKSLGIDKLIYPEPGKDFHELEHTDCYYMLDRLQHDRYDCVRRDPRFVSVVEKLNQYAK